MRDYVIFIAYSRRGDTEVEYITTTFRATKEDIDLQVALVEALKDEVMAENECDAGAEFHQVYDYCISVNSITRKCYD